MDITEALAPTSDQLDAVELVHPRTFTIDDGSRLGTREGKKVAEIRLVGFDRVWRPSKGMLDLLAACWGTDAKVWVGHRVTVYNDPDVMFGKERTGGVRISHLSHIDKARDVLIRAAGAGKKRSWHVEPLPDVALAGDIDTITDRDTLRAMWSSATDEQRARITARVAELDSQPATLDNPLDYSGDDLGGAM